MKRRPCLSDTSSLGIALPALPPGEVYSLLSVGGVRRNAQDPARYEVQLYLQARHNTTLKHYVPASVLQPYVDMQCASVLQAGSAWTPTGHRAPEFDFYFPDQCLMKLGCVSPRLVLASEAFANNELEDVIHVAGRSSMWLAIWEWSGVQWITPCFELLRILYYCAGSRLIDFYFSRLPAAWLGKLVAHPSANNGYGAHLCVAAQSISSTEAQVIAALLSDRAYRTIIYRTHAELARQWMQGQSTALFHTDLRLDRNAYFRAQGFSFTWAGRPAFWASVLQPKPHFFNFRHVLYHPLLLLCLKPGMIELAEHQYTDVLADLGPCAVKENYVSSGFRTRLLTAGSFAPHVTRGFPWAVKATDHAPHYLEAQTPLPWEDVSNYEINQSLVTIVFTRLEKQFEQHGRHVRRLSINNPNALYGEGWCICLYGGHLPLLGTIYSRHLLRFAITEITYGAGYFYLIYSGQHGTCVLARFADMHQLTLAEQQTLLNILSSEARQHSRGRGKLYPVSWKRGMLLLDAVSLASGAKKSYAQCEYFLSIPLGRRTH
ncbi:hypothetical protein [Hymenobacter sp. GOD-10R]|uniref:hypothetical protein n=1 Tax=Hymenobacter sp. GOD-10R TaxID=3093922 RepID=UPI002D7A20FC|nr:hypothetical protein [Hymenobacter sp. GOD-10R]WRQ28115.1 hypothetical protein SD425_23915 [Hymenobacter sp. GOD-10R]